jgi:uncharacterized protein (DUF1697 family)
MPRYVALLRAINVGGHTVTMSELRRLFEPLGLTDVRTFIASGNVIFESTSRSPRTLETRIERHLAGALGYKVETFIRTPAELAAASEHPAFPKKTLAAPGSSLYVMFLKSALAPASAAAVIALRTTNDEFHVNGREVYWFARGKMTQTLVNSTQLAKALGVSTTMRNVTTVRKLAALTASAAS